VDIKINIVFRSKFMASRCMCNFVKFRRQCKTYTISVVYIFGCSGGTHRVIAPKCNTVSGTDFYPCTKF